MKRQPWLSTQSGKPLEISVQPGRQQRWWSVRGELDTDLGYDASGEWIACEFDAGGELAKYEILSGSGKIAALWATS